MAAAVAAAAAFVGKVLVAVTGSATIATAGMQLVTALGAQAGAAAFVNPWGPVVSVASKRRGRFAP